MEFEEKLKQENKKIEELYNYLNRLEKELENVKREIDVRVGRAQILRELIEERKEKYEQTTS